MKFKIVSNSVASLEEAYFHGINRIDWDPARPAFGLQDHTEVYLGRAYITFYHMALDLGAKDAKRQILESFPGIVSVVSDAGTPKSLPDMARAIAYAALFKESPIVTELPVVDVDYSNDATLSDLRELKPGYRYNVSPGVRLSVTAEGKYRLEQDQDRAPLNPQEAGALLSFLNTCPDDHPLHGVSVSVTPDETGSVNNMLKKVAPFTRSRPNEGTLRHKFYQMLSDYLDIEHRAKHGAPLPEALLGARIKTFLKKNGATPETWYKAATFKLFEGRLSVHLPPKPYFEVVTNRTIPKKTGTGESFHFYGCSVGGEIGTRLVTQGRFASLGGKAHFYDVKGMGLSNKNRMMAPDADVGNQKPVIRMGQVNREMTHQAVVADTHGFTFGTYLETVLIPLFKGGQRQFVFNEMDNPSARACLQLANGLAIQVHHIKTGNALPLYELGVADNPGDKPHGHPMTYIMFPEEYAASGSRSPVLYNPSLLGLVKTEGWTRIAQGKLPIDKLIDTIGGEPRCSEELRYSFEHSLPLSQPPGVVNSAAAESIKAVRLLINTLSEVDSGDRRPRFRSGYTWDGVQGVKSLLGVGSTEGCDDTLAIYQSSDPSNLKRFFAVSTDTDSSQSSARSFSSRGSDLAAHDGSEHRKVRKRPKRNSVWSRSSSGSVKKRPVSTRNSRFPSLSTPDLIVLGHSVIRNAFDKRVGYHKVTDAPVVRTSAQSSHPGRCSPLGLHPSHPSFWQLARTSHA
jgi:hypothetical protein